MTIEIASLSTDEDQALGESQEPTISADGQYVAFASTATNLVTGDSNGNWDVFLRDLASGTTTLVSVNSSEVQGNAESWDAAISSDGTAVAFQSFASNLVGDDTNGYYDVFLRDLTAGTTVRVSVNSSEEEANNDAYNPAVSSDGGYVAFESLASNLVGVGGDTNNQYDIFLRDVVAGTTQRVSITDGEGQSDGESRRAAISDDGNIVVFESDATNLIGAGNDTNAKRDVFFRDIGAGATVRISVADDESEADGDSWGAELGANGTYYVFTSNSTNLIGAGNDTNGVADIFLRDYLMGTTERISVSSTGEEANGNSWGASVSSNGRYVTFYSAASNLVSSDTNGVADIFVRDRVSGTTSRVVAFDGEQGTGASTYPAISDDGSTIAFISSASNLVEGDTNAYADAFVASNPPSAPAMTLDILAAASGYADWRPSTGSSVVPVTPPAPSSTLVVWPGADGTVTHVIGHDFTYAVTGEPTGGIVTDIEHRTSYNGTVLAQGSGLNHSLVQIYEYLSSDAPDALTPFFAYILNGDDTITSADTDATELAGFAGDDIITAGDGNDEIDGGIGADTIDGSAGEDTIEGGEGADAIDGGSQATWDIASYESSPEAVEINLATATAKGGDAEGDTLTEIEGLAGSSYADKLTGDAGMNYFWGGAGTDTIDGGDGDDLVDYRDAPSAVNVNLAAGTATGGHGSDTLISIEDVSGTAGNDTLTGDANDNVLWGGNGSDVLDGGAGYDLVSYSGWTAAATVNLLTGVGSMSGFGTDSLANFEGIEGSQLNDSLTGDAGDNEIEGRAGSDSIDGGADAMMGDTARYWHSLEAVQVSLATGATNTGGDAAGDVLVNIENLEGTDFDDTLTGNDDDNILTGRSGADALDGGKHGKLGDTADYSNSPGAVTVSLATGSGTGSDAEGDTLSNIENLIGSDSADTLTGDAGDNVIEGRAGADIIDGGGNGALGDTASYWSSSEGVQVDLNLGTGNNGDAEGDTLTNIENLIGSAYGDTLTGSGDDNTLAGGSGDDTLDGSSGTDTATYEDDTAGVMASVFSGKATGISSGNDTLISIENISGGSGGDQLQGSGIANVLSGNAGDDMIDGQGGDDTLAGGSGTNMLDGGADTDTAVFAGNLADYKAIVISGGYRITDQRSGQPGGIHDTTNIEWFQFDDQTVDASGLPLNKAPTDIALTNDTVAESSVNGTEVGTLTATDPDTGETFTYTLTDNAGGRFAIGGAGNDRIVVANGSLLDYETATSHDVTVKVTDSASNTYSEVMTINVSDVAATIINGTASADKLTGTNQENQINGLAGNDTLEGLGDNDTLDGGLGIDTASYASDTAGVTVDLSKFTATGASVGTDTLISIESVIGGSGDDHITGDDLATGQVLDGRAGADTIEGGLGADKLIGGEGDDMLSYMSSSNAIKVSLALTSAQNTGGAGTDTISGFENLLGGVGNDTLTGSAGNNTIDGREGNDTINGGAGDDLLRGRDGDDVLIGGAGADLMDGDDGINTASYVGSTLGVTIDLGIGWTAQGGAGDGLGDKLDSIQNLIGSAKNDTLTGDANDNVIEGGLGNDTLAGGAHGANGDTLSYASATSTVTVDLAAGTVSGAAGIDTFSGFENVAGGAGADTLKGDANANKLAGNAGNDILHGGGANGAGDDTLDGGAGTDLADYSADTAGINASLVTGGTATGALIGTDTLVDIENLTGGAGDDTIEASGANNKLIGGGNTAAGDTLSYANTTGAVKISLALTSAQATGGSGSDTISGFENLTGGKGNDTLTGSTLVNVISGGDGNDTLYGGTGGDTLNGDAGDDILVGGTNGDTLDGGDGSDTASYATSALEVSVDLTLAVQSSKEDASGDKLISIENLIGSAKNDKLTGDGKDNVIEGGLGNDILAGGANEALGDTVSYASATASVIVDLSKGTVSGAAGIDTISGFENVAGGSGADTLTGDGGANSLIGNGGDDKLAGGAGDDLLDGGAGSDTADYGSDTAGVEVHLDAGWAEGMNIGKDNLDSIENAIGGSGNDSIEASDANNVIAGGAGVDDTLVYQNTTKDLKVSLAIITAQATGGSGTDTISGFENLAGGSGNDTLTGSTEINKIWGQGGNDTLSGGTGVGSDYLYGEGDDDVLIGGGGADTLDGGDGSDTASYVGSAIGVSVYLSKATQSGSGDEDSDTFVSIENVTGSAKNDFLYGDGNDNVIEGAIGNDWLEGGGHAAGGDTLSYRGATSAVKVSLALQGTAQSTGGGGIDTFKEFENLAGGAGADTLTGDANINIITGNAGNDIIDGGVGIDTLIGGLGNDTYYVDDALDVVTEIAGQGTDLVRASVSYELADNIENLLFLGAADLDGTGNSLANTLTGNTGANKLDGGAGADKLIGGLGDDSYVVDNIGDKITETSTGGTDEVASSISYTLGSYLEKLMLTGSANINGTGNTLANEIQGNDGDNVLTGGSGNDQLAGGAGADTLVGGLGNDWLEGEAGADAFLFNATLNATTNVDHIVDFALGEDQIWLENAIFTRLTVTGTLSADAFYLGANAHDADDRILYDQAAGALYYDSDGTGAAAKMQFAVLDVHAALQNTDFKVV